MCLFQSTPGQKNMKNNISRYWKDTKLGSYYGNDVLFACLSYPKSWLWRLVSHHGYNRDLSELEYMTANQIFLSLSNGKRKNNIWIPGDSLGISWWVHAQQFLSMGNFCNHSPTEVRQKTEGATQVETKCWLFSKKEEANLCWNVGKELGNIKWECLDVS